MAIKTLNSVGGFSVKDINGNAVIIIDSNGNVSTPDLTVLGQSNLGNLGNVKITGGSANYLVSTDGIGNLTWVAPGNISQIQNGTSKVYIPDTNGNVYISATSGEVWTFDTTGSLTFPGPVKFWDLPYGPPGTTGAARILLYPGDEQYAIGVDDYTTWIQSAGYITSYISDTATSKLTAGGLAVTGLAISTDVLAGTTAGTGVVNFTDASNVTLGSVGNLHITGGTAGYVLTTDGAGTLSWNATGSPSIIQNGNSNVSVPLADGNVYISANASVDQQWNFDTTGNLTGPAAGTANLGNLVTANSFTAGAGTIDFITNAPNVQLGNVANVHIKGGTSGQVLATDGNGNLSFVDQGGGTNIIAAPMPYYINTNEVYTVPLYRQGLFSIPIDINDGVLEVDGILIEV